MKKGRFGVSLTAIAAIAFLFTALRQPQSVLLVAGFALLAEKDEWLNRQVLQALLLTIAYYLAAMILDWIFGGISKFFGYFGVYIIQNTMAQVNTFFGDLVYIVLIVFTVIALIKVIGGKDAGLPFISKLVVSHIPVQPASPPVEQPPVQQAEVETEAQNAVKEESYNLQSNCSSCGAPLGQESRFCTQCGAKNE